MLSNVADAVKRTPVLLLGLPAQHVDESAGRLACAGGHRLPLHGVVDGARHDGLIQMGGEGVDWASHSMFTKTPHVFQNLGDGTYFHSGILAIRQAVAAGPTSPTRFSITTPSR